MKNRLSVLFLLAVFLQLPTLSALAQTPPAPKAGNAPSTAVAPGTPSPGALPIAEQEKLAKKLYADMSHLDRFDFDSFIAMHQDVIQKCPNTTWAEESHWRLSNLYYSGKSMLEGRPDYPKVIEILEQLLARYPKTKLAIDAQKRLLLAYQENGNFDKVVEIYARRFQEHPKLPDDLFLTWALGYGEALEKTGKPLEAKKLYEEMITRDSRGISFQTTIAKKRLAGIGGK